MRLRETIASDLEFVVATETNAAKGGFVTCETIKEHSLYLEVKDVLHLIIELGGEPIGYVILAGLSDPHDNIELKRIVLGKTGRGFGRNAIKMIKEIAFAKLSAHRLWLDVFEHNDRARGLYESEGFFKEGIWRQCVKNGDTRKSLVFMSILKDEYRKNI